MNIFTFVSSKAFIAQNQNEIQQQMQKGQQIKARKPKGLEVNRFPIKTERMLQQHAYQTTFNHYLINIKKEKVRKGSQKINNEKMKITKPKKIKYITEQIQNSTQDLLSIRSHSNRKSRSIKFSTQNVQDDAYQICKSSKRSNIKKQRDGKEQEEKHTHRPNKINIGNVNVKTRKKKTHSKDHEIKPKIVTGKLQHKSAKKLQRGPSSNRTSEYKPERHHFLSPQIVKQQNSYYFSNCAEQQPIFSQNILGVQKKQPKYLFESSKSLWNDQPHKKILKSTIDLLN